MKNVIIILLLFALAASGCSFGGATPNQSFDLTPRGSIASTLAPVVPTITSTDVPTPIPPTETPMPTPTSTALALYPDVAFAQKTDCLKGPDKHYFLVVTFQQGQSTQARSRNADSSWILVQVPDKVDSCWVPASSVQNLPDASVLQVVDAQPLPVSAQNIAVTPSNVCGSAHHLVLTWSYTEGIGYYIYRNGHNIATVYGGQYIDFDTPRTKTPYVYVYTIEAFNSVGAAEGSSESVTLCQ